jgi:hypothetical protein
MRSWRHSSDRPRDDAPRAYRSRCFFGVDDEDGQTAASSITRSCLGEPVNLRIGGGAQYMSLSRGWVRLLTCHNEKPCAAACFRMTSIATNCRRSYTSHFPNTWYFTPTPVNVATT